MCRFVAYLGQPTTLEQVISKPTHSLIVQSYQPLEMTAGTVNADGFGVGWYNRMVDPTPCVYTNVCPIWSDRNLPSLSRHITSECIFANVRSATPGISVDQSNCQPFAYKQFMCMHNGYIENFRFTLMRRIRDALQDEYYTAIHGSTDSEHLFALFLNFLHGQMISLEAMVAALSDTISQIDAWAEDVGVRVALNLALTDGEIIVASRFANIGAAPSLYCVRDAGIFPHAAVIASERLWAGDDWSIIPEDCIVGYDASLALQRYSLERRVCA
ncbi:MAG TPA: ergothioneine biosynthesis protein EgtC [Methylomirabilota bacterium]|jgi:glutamine amidotransferase|nr:ergothioneine biosynthesis protein EgtC [Methylomirabilota bacterium]